LSYRRRSYYIGGLFFNFKNMKIKSKLIQRIVIGKAIWFIFWIIAFSAIPYIFHTATVSLGLWVWFWYTTLWAIIWVFWVMDTHPLFKMRIHYWFRWTILWLWMNFILILLMHPYLLTIIQNSSIKWFSPFCLLIEWAIFWLFVDFIATKYAWEWKELIEKK